MHSKVRYFETLPIFLPFIAVSFTQGFLKCFYVNTSMKTQQSEEENISYIQPFSKSSWPQLAILTSTHFHAVPKLTNGPGSDGIAWPPGSLIGKSSEFSTVWKFSNFSVTQILREINFRQFAASNSATLTVLVHLKFDFGEFQPFCRN